MFNLLIDADCIPSRQMPCEGVVNTDSPCTAHALLKHQILYQEGFDMIAQSFATYGPTSLILIWIMQHLNCLTTMPWYHE